MDVSGPLANAKAFGTDSPNAFQSVLCRVIGSIDRLKETIATPCPEKQH
jgi:hypothetical protein